MASILNSSLSYASAVASSVSGQKAPIKGRSAEMKKNNAGGFTFQVSPKDYLLRMMILGTTKNTYYVDAKELTDDAVQFVLEQIGSGNGQEVLDVVTDVYSKSRAPKFDFVLAVLAILSCSEDLGVKQGALAQVSQLRTAMHLYQWKQAQKTYAKSKGFGRAVRRTLSTWALQMSAKSLLFQTTKYQNRSFGKEAWCIGDLIKCAHVNTANGDEKHGGEALSGDQELVLRYIVKGYESAMQLVDTVDQHRLNLGQDLLADSPVVKYLVAVETAKHMAESDSSVVSLVQLIHLHHLPREVLPTWSLNRAEIWMALLLNKDLSKVVMPFTALVRNLGKMSSLGLFADPVVEQLVGDHLRNGEIVKSSRIHPVQLLVAQLTYSRGQGVKGKLSWVVSQPIASALQEAFYLSFDFVEPTGKRILHCIDGSGSMTSSIPNCELISSADAVAVMAMVHARIEKDAKQDFVLFSSNGRSRYDHSGTGLRQVQIKSTDSFELTRRTVQLSDFGSTDCALPIMTAIATYQKSGGQDGLYDAFVVYTDNETYDGQVHASEAIKQYRELTGIPAKMVVVGTLASPFTIADPADGGMMDVCGFDTQMPQFVLNFIRGNSEEVQDEDFDLCDE